MWKIFKKKRDDATETSAPRLAAAPPPVEAKPSPRPAPARAKPAAAVFLRPLVSEKMSAAGAVDTYGFVVRRQANKIEVAKAFAGLYKVNPVSVRMMIVPAKRKRTGRTYGLRPAWKKALVRVPPGAKVDIFTGV